MNIVWLGTVMQKLCSCYWQPMKGTTRKAAVRKIVQVLSRLRWIHISEILDHQQWWSKWFRICSICIYLFIYLPGWQQPITNRDMSPTGRGRGIGRGGGRGRSHRRGGALSSSPPSPIQQQDDEDGSWSAAHTNWNIEHLLCKQVFNERLSIDMCDIINVNLFCTSMEFFLNQILTGIPKGPPSVRLKWKYVGRMKVNILTRTFNS